MSSKRQRSESPVDLDKEFRPRKQHRPATPTTGVMIDLENVMDNWLISSRESRKQRDSEDRLDRVAWMARKALDPSEIRDKAGRWQYHPDETERRWVEVAPQTGYNVRRLTRSARNLSLNKSQAPNRAFRAEKGEKEISSLYREYWMGNDKEGFLDALYKSFAQGDFIPEKTIWKIFRCLISELVSDEDKWKTIPLHIIAEPNTIWQAGKCVLQIITRGRFWDDEFNVLQPVDSGIKFGEFKKNTLHAKYSKNLLKYILGCLSLRESERYTRAQLLNHFDEVFSVYKGTYVPPIVDDTKYAPYKPKKIFISLIPNGLTNEEGEVYEKLIAIAEARATQGTGVLTPHIITVTDLAKDYDDLMALMCLKELHRLGIVQIEGFVANLMPAERRALFGRGALDSLYLYDIPCAIGTKGDPNRVLNEQSHEFDNTGAFMPLKADLPKGPKLLEDVFSRAMKENRKMTLLGISSLMDIAEFSETQEELLEKGLGNVVLQGGYRVIDGVLTADSAAANNKFDMAGSNKFHKFMQEHMIPSTVWTKVATEAVSIYNTLFEFLDQTGHPLGSYIRKVQVTQDLNFYSHACNGPLFAPHMTQDWYVKTKSTWFAAGHEPDEPYPSGHDMVPFFTKVVAYDALAAVGSAGEDVLQAFGIIKPFTSRPDAAHPTHRLIGVPKVVSEGLPQDQNLDGDKIGVVITALMKGSILAVQQGLEYS